LGCAIVAATKIARARPALKSHIFENVLLSTKRPHGRTIINLFRKLKLSYSCSNSTSLPPPQPWNKARVKPPDLPPKHTLHTLNKSFP